MQRLINYSILLCIATILTLIGCDRSGIVQDNAPPLK